uniref:Ephrin RBD domain-containing protein n=1 Tax=Panagrellus redivivus TaxID=6233 RepID=A0A7E4V4R2_PANRE
MRQHCFLIFFVGIHHCSADVNLFLNDEVTVTFNGPELLLNVENPRLKKWEQFTLCLKSVPSTVQKYCPKGYASFFYWVIGQERIRYRMTRSGKIVGGQYITIKAVQFPPGCYVHLVNAEKVIPTTTTIPRSTITTTQMVATASFTIYYVIGGLTLLFVLIVGVVTAYICWSRKSRSSNDVQGERKPNIKAGKSTQPNTPQSSRNAPKPKTNSGVKPSSMLQPLEIHPSSGSEQSECHVLK